jgi:two-component system, NtrC family, nitrogen regulation response regulator GlnG
MTIPATSLPVLLVDDEPQLLRAASLALRSGGITHVLERSDSRMVLPLLAEQSVGAVVVDLSMPHLSGQALLAAISADYPEIPVIVMTGSTGLDTAIDCMKCGAVDYLVKPTEAHRLCTAVRKALETRALRTELLSLKDTLLTARAARHPAFAEFATQSRRMLSIFRYLEAVAPSPQPVLITGETGTGKELIARAIHAMSGRRDALVAVNVAGLDDGLFSDTLFGHTRGAFTSAEHGRDGMVHSAREGTLFLDEIGDLAPASQVRMLRLLQDGTYYPVGSDQLRRSRARIVVATNRDVLRDVAAGRFRRDLYDRLHTHHV